MFVKTNTLYPHKTTTFASTFAFETTLLLIYIYLKIHGLLGEIISSLSLIGA
jgi:hypothetical protein